MKGKLFYRIREVAELLELKPYVLRFWETEFPMIKPVKSPTGHRVYQPADVEILKQVKHLLYVERYSIEGARKRIRELKRKKEVKDKVLNVRDSITELGALIRKPLSDFFELSTSMTDTSQTRNNPRC